MKKITFIVGAGASKEFGLPIGLELKKRIADLLDITIDDFNRLQSSDRAIIQALQLVASEKKNGDMNPYILAGWRIRDAMPQAISIDNFIDNHQGDGYIEICGKLAIARSILTAERESSLYFDLRRSDSRLNFVGTDGCWLAPLTRRITENCRADQLEERLASISFVIFNYDRCIEHYLYYALQNYYALSASRVAELLGAVDFYHPYGSVGSLPWQANKNVSQFGESLPPDALLSIARQIKTFTEGADPQSSEICDIRKSVDRSESLIFLGFAFHRLNMQLIHPEEVTFDETSQKRAYATAIGLSDSDCKEIHSELSRMRGSPKVDVRNNLTCSQIFYEYTRGISLS